MLLLFSFLFYALFFINNLSFYFIITFNLYTVFSDYSNSLYRLISLSLHTPHYFINYTCFYLPLLSLFIYIYSLFLLNYLSFYNLFIYILNLSISSYLFLLSSFHYLNFSLIFNIIYYINPYILYTFPILISNYSHNFYTFSLYRKYIYYYLTLCRFYSLTKFLSDYYTLFSIYPNYTNGFNYRNLVVNVLFLFINYLFLRYLSVLSFCRDCTFLFNYLILN
jgi:hypothetical protein